MTAPGGPGDDDRTAPPDAGAAGAGAGSLQLSLVSHTNAGKTTLARTLLQRDVGEVRDAPHVTEFVDGHEMLRTPQGETLRLWDTPGFGDSVRLRQRLAQSAQPLGWFLSQVWDRWRDRPFWASQQALRHVAATTDVVLYLVSAAETPEGAAYVAPEMALLGWVGKPVIVLLNQLGPPREAAREAAELQRWREHLATFAPVAEVLPLDAFARCWVQERVLLQAVERQLDGPRRRLMQRLTLAWQVQRLAVFDASVDALAQSMGRLAAARHEVGDPDWKLRLRGLGAALGLRDDERDPARLAQAALAAELDAEVRANTTRLLELHHLPGQAQDEILTRLGDGFQLRLRVDEGKAALIGGAVSGALAGLKADLASGGLTLGGGLLAGGLLGALGGAGVARAMNVVRGTGRSWLAWNAASLDTLLEAALLRYLAVAHFGRGRGEWTRAECPPHWQPVVADALREQQAALDALWAGRHPGGDAPAQAGPLADALRPRLDRALRTVLARLYPDSPVPAAPGMDAAGASG